MPKSKAMIDDGFNPELVRGARFDGIFEIPHIYTPNHIGRLNGFTPFSKRGFPPTSNEALCFFEMDIEFADVLRQPELYIEEFASFSALVPTDNSLYRDASLAVQIGNIYKSRAIGSYYQRNGSNVIPLVRWGDGRTYTEILFPEKVAFAGIEKGSPVVVSTYGCIRGKENRRHFKAGLEAMVAEIEPSRVFVYGSMPGDVFRSVLDRADFMQFPDWITRKKSGDSCG